MRLMVLHLAGLEPKPGRPPAWVREESRLRLVPRPPRARRRPRRVRRHAPVPHSPEHQARRRPHQRGRRDGHQARPRAVRERHPARCDGGEVANHRRCLEVTGGAPAAPLPGGWRGVARRRRARALRHQRPVRRTLPGLTPLSAPSVRPRKSTPAGSRSTRSRTPSSSAATASRPRDRRGSSADCSGHRCSSTSCGTSSPSSRRRPAREEAAALPAVPRGDQRLGANPEWPYARAARRSNLAYPRFRQIAHDALARHQAASFP